MRILCAVQPREAIRKILECLGIPSRPPPLGPALDLDDPCYCWLLTGRRLRMLGRRPARFPCPAASSCVTFVATTFRGPWSRHITRYQRMTAGTQGHASAAESEARLAKRQL